MEKVIEMIHISGAKLNTLSYISSKGILFVLTIPESTHTPFTSMNGNKSGSVSAVVLKCAAITPYTYEIPDLSGKTFTKSGESFEKFKTEAELQNAIWEKSASPNGTPFTPAVLDFSKTASNYFKRIATDIFLLSICADDFTRALLTSLMEINKPVAILTMELLDTTYSTMHSLIQSGKSPDHLKTISKSILAKMAYLFITLKIVNYDAYPTNIMVSEWDEQLIDFGFVLSLEDFMSELPNVSDGDGNALGILNMYNEYKGEDTLTKDYAEVNAITLNSMLPSTRSRAAVLQASINMKKIIEFISIMDYASGQTFLHGMDKPRMDPLLKYAFEVEHSKWTTDPANPGIHKFPFPNEDSPIWGDLVFIMSPLVLINVDSSASKSVKKRTRPCFDNTYGTEDTVVNPLRGSPGHSTRQVVHEEATPNLGSKITEEDLEEILGKTLHRILHPLSSRDRIVECVRDTCRWVRNTTVKVFTGRGSRKNKRYMYERRNNTNKHPHQSRRLRKRRKPFVAIP